MDLQTRRRLFNACDPDEPIGPNDSRYVAIDDTIAGARIRGGDWVTNIQDELLLSERPLFKLLTGLPGSGKSTELRRLEAAIRDQHRSVMLPVHIDAEEHLDLTAAVDVVDILATVVERTEAAVRQAEGKPEATADEQSFVTRFWTWLSETDVELKSAQFGVADAAKLTVELRSRPNLRARVREVVSAHLPTFVSDVHNALTDLQSRAVAAGSAGGIVVIYDSLEKLRGTSTSYEQVLDSCERLFAQGGRYLRLPVHVIYTVPPALRSRAVMRDMTFFPMLKLRERDHTPSEVGLQVARSLVSKRVPDDTLHEQLGPEWRSHLDRLLLWSGGFPREIVRMLRNIVKSQGTFTDADIDVMMKHVTSEFRDLIHTSEYGWLARVARDKQLASDTEQERRIADRLLANGAVFRYVNGGDWWDLHPAVEAIEGIQAALAVLRAGERTGKGNVPS
ncbi:MAG: hypothetical protein H6747_04995 [Deltaproteobacteria bacterium]|nr:hypothetical protein [Deltaproteobacteria bacterium]